MRLCIPARQLFTNLTSLTARFFALLLLLLGAFQASAQAQTYTYGGATYTYTGYGSGQIQITGISVSAAGAITIPTTINSIPVTRIIDDPTLTNPTDITGLTIPSGVTYIGVSAFQGCTGIASLTIPGTVTTISNHAFYDCTALTTVTIPEGVTTIGFSAFESCNGLVTVSLPSTLTSLGISVFLDDPGLTAINVASQNMTYSSNAGVLFSKDGTTLIQYPGGATGSYVVPNGVTTLADYAFNLSNISGVTLPSSVTSIGMQTFSGCSNLTSATLDSGLTTIGEEAFYITGLTSISIPASVTSIGDYAFGSTPLTSLTLNNGLASIGVGSFIGTAITSVSIPNSVTSIGGFAFENCTSLSSLSLGSGVTTIGGNAFYGCTALTSLTIPTGVTSLGGFCFQNCTGLTSLEIPGNVTLVGGYAFAGCTGLTSLTLDPGVAEIGSYAFNGCSGITGVSFPTSVTEIDTNAFSNCATLASFTFAGNAPTTIGADAFLSGAAGATAYYYAGSTGFTTPTWVYYNAPLPENYHSQITTVNLGSPTDEFTITTSGGQVTITGYSGPGGAVIIPGTINSNPVTSIAASAFVGITSLTSVTIPSSVTSIGNSAFAGCTDLAAAIFDGNAPTIGSGAFANTASSFQIEYNDGATGFTQPTYTDSSNDTYASADISAPVIQSASTVSATLDAPFTYTIVATDSPTHFSMGYAIPGLTLNATTGVLSGKPTVLTNYGVEITASNAFGSGSIELNIDVNPIPVTVTLSNLAVNYTGKPQGAKVTTVPAGVPVTVTYTGTGTAPTAVGSYTVTATVNKANYGGTATGTFVIGPILPLVATSTATGITASGATLNGIVNPETSDTSVSFQWGTSIAYGNTTTPTDAGSGTANTTFNAAITVPVQTTAAIYYYRAVATNAKGTVYGAAKAFIAPGRAQIVAPPEAALGATGAEVNLSVNPDGVATSVYFKYSLNSDLSSALTTTVQNLGAGKVPVNVFALFPNLAPGMTYYYELVMTSAAGTFTSDTESFTTPGFDTGLIALKGEAATGTSTTFALFGPGAVNAEDKVAFAATLTPASGITAANDFGIWIGTNTDTQTLIAQTGSASPGVASTFTALSDPAFNDNGAVAFRGTLKAVAGQVTAANYIGLWSTANVSSSLQLVARQGSTAPGTSGTFASFTAFGLTQSGNTIFSGTLNAGTGITAANYTGIWEGDTAADLTLQLRLGQNVGGKNITSYTFLPAELYVNGQTRSFNANGDIACHVTFAGGSGLVKVVGGSPAFDRTSGSPADGLSSPNYATFGNPAINDTDEIAYSGTLSPAFGGITAATEFGIWADDNTGTRQLIAQSGILGEAPLHASTGTFTTFSDPVYNNNEAVAFRATLKVGVGGVTATTATGIWATDGSAGSLALVAQQGVTQAPGCPAGATFALFTELALADQGGAGDTGGVIFMATLNASATAGVNATNYIGIWAVDSTGALQLIARTGDVINVGTDVAPVYKTVTALTFLPAPLYVNGTSRSFDQANGDLVYQATFSDKSTAILNVVF